MTSSFTPFSASRATSATSGARFLGGSTLAGRLLVEAGAAGAAAVGGASVGTSGLVAAFTTGGAVLDTAVTVFGPWLSSPLQPVVIATTQTTPKKPEIRLRGTFMEVGK